MALKSYDSSLELNKSYYYTYLNISAIYIEEKEYNKSIEILSEGIDINKDAEDLYYNRACSYAILDMEEEAISDIRKALSLNPAIISWVIRDKDFESLYNNDDFINLLNEYN